MKDWPIAFLHDILDAEQVDDPLEAVFLDLFLQVDIFDHGTVIEIEILALARAISLTSIHT